MADGALPLDHLKRRLQLTAEDVRSRYVAERVGHHVWRARRGRCTGATQAWLTVYNLVGSAEVRRKYHFNHSASRR